MDKRVTIRDVALKAGVSQGTVSRVINGKSVRPLIKQRVLQSIEALGYEPNVIARSMRTNTTRTIGLIVADITNPVLAAIVKGAEEYLYLQGYTLVVANTGNFPSRESELVRIFAQRRVDGLLLTVTEEGNPLLHDALRETALPTTLIDRHLPVKTDTVYVDHATGMYQATRYLLSLGHRRIALITGGDTIYPGRERVRGFQKAFEDAGISIDFANIRSKNLSVEYGLQQTQELLKSDNRPTAIIAGGNQILNGVIEATLSRNLSIPSDISIIACDDTPLTRLWSPGITVIRRDLREIGQRAAEMLMNRILGIEDGPPREIVLPTEIILRQSCSGVTG